MIKRRSYGAIQGFNPAVKREVLTTPVLAIQDIAQPSNPNHATE